MHSHNYTLRQLYGRRFIEGEADVFILDRVPSLPRLALRALGQTIRDWREDLREGALSDLPVAPIRRAVDAWAYGLGTRHGLRRRRLGDPDIRHGQRVVLLRHPSRR